MKLASIQTRPLRTARLAAVPWRVVISMGFAAAMCLLGACDDPSTQACRINSDCAVNETCVQGSCLVLCREARDCPAGETCTSGRCEPIFGGNCADDGDCRNGEACIAGVCQRVDGVSDDVTGDSDVPDDTHDTTSPDDDTAPSDTQPPEDTTPPQDTAVDTTMDADQDTVTDTGVDTTTDTGVDTTVDTTMDTAMDTTDTTPPVRKGYGESCMAAGECESNLCIGGSSGVGTCTKSCLTRSECDAGADACIDVGANQKVCAPDDTDTPCSSPTECVYQACISAAGDLFSPALFCSLPCASSAECKPGHTCSPMRCYEQSGLRLCKPTLVALLSTNREQELTDFPVDARYCLPMGEPVFCPDELETRGECANALCDQDNQICTGQCLLDSDCPGALACDPIDTSDPRIPLGICHQLP